MSFHIRALSLFLFVFLFLLGCSLPEIKKGSATSYHFNRPAQIWEESFPLGNGRLGMMPDGGVESENIVLNEISLWSGSKQDANNPQAYWYLASIRRLLFDGRNEEAQELMYRTFVCKGEGSGLGAGSNVPYGCYQMLGNLTIDYLYPQEKDPITNYRRELRLEDAISYVNYRKASVDYRREIFTSFTEDLGVVYLTADVDRSLDLNLGMNRPERSEVYTEGGELVLSGQLSDGAGGDGMQYMARLRVILPKGGNLQIQDSTLSIRQASEVILLVGMATDYFEENYQEQIRRQLNAAARKDYVTLKREHLSAYQEKFNRVELDLGVSERENLPIDERLALFANDKNDPGLPVLYFQFGRYLLISSTRPGSLPPNLQGLWANSIQTPWNGDYHLNINLQMNLWPAEVTNLAELHQPLVEWVTQQVPSGEQTAKVYYNARGWVTHILGNVWEFTAPGEHPSWGATNTSAAWLCAHLYSHYQFNPDTTFLRKIYPVMKGAALFFTDMLVEDPRNKYLVTAPTTSPENSFLLPNGSIAAISAGSTMDNQILRELFTNVIEAATILRTDALFAEELRQKRERLMPTTVAKDGRIMEWLEPFQEIEPTHRHVSHLYGLYPAAEITPDLTPELAEAARKTLKVRGDQSTGWSMAWKINFWARLKDGDHSYKLITDLLQPCLEPGKTEATKGGTYPNLFCSHPPFQIDGNFGACAGIAEMLLQSHTGVIELLPALPQDWAKGSFRGLRVRGGGEVSARWNEHRITEAIFKVTSSGIFSLRLPPGSVARTLRINQRAVSLPVIDGLLTLEMAAGDELLIQFD